jgi:hypothetical protein
MQWEEAIEKMSREREFTGKAGTIYLSKFKHEGNPWQVWFEDFRIIGDGKSQREVLQDALLQAEGISALVSSALVTLNVKAEQAIAAGGK